MFVVIASLFHTEHNEAPEISRNISTNADMWLLQFSTTTVALDPLVPLSLSVRILCLCVCVGGGGGGGGRVAS